MRIYEEFKPNFSEYEKVFAEINERYETVNKMAKNINEMFAIIPCGRHKGRIGIVHHAHAGVYGVFCLLSALRLDSRGVKLKCSCSDCRNYYDALKLKYIRW
jgi:hypothetical protein